jgi:uracil-DNA glycosylase
MSVNIQEIKEKLYDKLKPSGWGDKLKSFILSEDFDKILLKLESEAIEGKRFVPQVKYMFSAFEKCPYDKLKVVMMGQDPYPYLGVPDGMAFSCSLRGKPEASLRYMFKEIEHTVYSEDGRVMDTNPDLTRWSQQGVLLLNSALTTTVGKPGVHQIMWRPFMSFLFDILSWYNPGLIYVFLGKTAGQWADSIPDNCYKLFASHPASAAHTNAERWDSKNVFNEVNGILLKNNNEKITW